MSRHQPPLIHTHRNAPAFFLQMEDKLDAIARGEKGRVDYLSEYYLGESGLKESVARKRADIDPLEAKRARLPGLEVRARVSVCAGLFPGVRAVAFEEKEFNSDMEGATSKLRYAFQRACQEACCFCRRVCPFLGVRYDACDSGPKIDARM